MHRWFWHSQTWCNVTECIGKLFQELYSHIYGIHKDYPLTHWNTSCLCSGRTFFFMFCEINHILPCLSWHLSKQLVFVHFCYVTVSLPQKSLHISFLAAPFLFRCCSEVLVASSSSCSLRSCMKKFLLLTHSLVQMLCLWICHLLSSWRWLD
jgi:hypothetical protein